MEKKEAIQVREKADTGRQRKKPPATKRCYSPYEPSLPPSKKKKMIEKSDAEESDVSAEYAEPNEFPTVAVSNASLREEYEPRRPLRERCSTIPRIQTKHLQSSSWNT
ncbi:hypothetical protein PI124_g4430 [Phytophthora idaei]|nr:hypothetical protein PI124_g4430 [Phytophthora idaei]